MTNYTILDEDLKVVGILDEYESCIWTERYNKYGDFEIFTIVNEKILDLMKPNRYVTRDDSEYVMIIEDLEISTDTDTGNTITIRGRSLESILDRRIIWEQTVFRKETLFRIIQTLLYENAILPNDDYRIIWELYFDGGLENDPVASLLLYAQYTGDNLYDVIHDLCITNNIGFKITIRETYDPYSPRIARFGFRLYSGVDRSYAQNVLPVVEFSQNFENLINSNYIYSNKPLKNVALVLGEGEGKKRRRGVVFPENTEEKRSLERRELLVDARDISSVDTATDSVDYAMWLQQRGREKLAENTETIAFDGKTETTQLYRYNEHFKMGDICELENEYGMTERVRVTEFIYSESKSNGVENYPTFVVVGHEQDED